MAPRKNLNAVRAEFSRTKRVTMSVSIRDDIALAFCDYMEQEGFDTQSHAITALISGALGSYPQWNVVVAVRQKIVEETRSWLRQRIEAFGTELHTMMKESDNELFRAMIEGRYKAFEGKAKTHHEDPP